MDETIVVEQPKKKSGTFLKLVLIIITLISLIAAAALGLLYYNAITNLELVREKNIELGQDRDKYKAQAAEYELQIEEFEQEIEDLSKQIAESQALLETPIIAGQLNDTDGDSATATASAEDAKITAADLANESTLDVQPTELYSEVVEYTVIKKGINMRSGPSTDYRTVQSAYSGNTLYAYAESGDWVCVKTAKGVFGWVRNDMIEKVQ